MEIIVLLNVFFGIVIVISLIILWFILPPDSPWSPWWQAREPREILKFAKVTRKDVVYDLGSGDGRIPIAAARYFGAKGVGIEFDVIRHLIAQLKVQYYGLSDKVILRRGNFFDFNISDATVVFAYLVPRVLEKIKPKLTKELEKGTKVISYKYEFKLNNKLKYIRSDQKNQIHLYQID